MTLLLLAGTAEAKDLAEALAVHRVRAVASLAGATRDPKTLALPTRVGGFGGRAGFEAYLRTEKITSVIDATHPFADHISHRSAGVCRAMGIPYLLLQRLPWEAGPGDTWIVIDREEDAANHIARDATVFLATGRQTLSRFGNLDGRRVICRQIDPPDAPFPFEGGEFLIGRPPFSVEQERRLFARLEVDWLVVKNAGGAASRTKLDAARQMGLPVLMIKRPGAPDAPTVATVSAALNWALAL